MSQLKCDGCRLRLQHDRIRTGPVSLSCPSCGGPLEPAERLDEIVGYRAIEGPLGSDLADGGTPARTTALRRPPPDSAV